MPERLSTFPNSRGGQPAYNTHYTLSLTPDKQELKLTFKQSFLQVHKWSNGDTSPEITFTADDGRKFGKKFSMNLKVNTAPILEYAGIGKTTESGEDHYVLIFQAKDMGTMIGTQHVHKDINIMNVTAGGVSRPPITLSVTGSDFATGGDLLAAVSQLDTAHLLPTGNGLLRLKTDVKVGGPETEYSVSIKDSQGLSSAVISAKTKKNKLADVELLDDATPIGATPSSEGATDGNPKVFAGMSGKTLTAQAAPAGAGITGKVEKQNDYGTWTETDTVSGTTPVTVNLPALAAGENEALYKITLKAQLSGYDDSDSKDFFVKLVRQEVPVLKLKQDFNQNTDFALYSISAGTEGYVSEDIITDAGHYTAEHPLVIYNAKNVTRSKLELSASAGTTVKYKLNSVPSTTTTATATITVIGSSVHTLEVWAEKGGIQGPHTTVHIKLVTAASNYTQLKNVVKNAPKKGTESGQYDYSSFINIKIDTDLSASAGDSEIAVTGGKKLMLSSSSSGTVRTINANNSRRIFKVSGAGTLLILENIKLEGGYAADGKGGAVYVEAGGILKLKEKTVITPSTGSDTNTRGRNDVYLADSALINVDSALTSAEPIVARITPEQYTDGITVLDGGNLLNTYTRFSVTQPAGSTDIWKIKSDGILQKISAVISGSDTLAWKRLKEAVRDLPEGSTITINGTINATNDSGNSDVIDITKNITIQGKNGANTDILNANSSASYYAPTPTHCIFKVQGDKKLTLKNLTLKDGEATSGIGGGAIYLLSSSEAELEGCIIEACKADKGGAIGCNKSSTVKLTNTTIKNCTAHTGGNTGTGGAIYAEGATVEMTGCTLTGNKADKGGGAIYAVKNGSTRSNVTISGGIIGGTGSGEPNKTIDPSGMGGGIYIGPNTTVTLQNDVQITGNTAKNGGGVYVTASDSIFKIKDTSRVIPSTGDEANVAGKNDVYLDDQGLEAKITVADSLTPQDGIAARITVEAGRYMITTKVLNGISELLSSEHGKFTVTQKIVVDGIQKWKINDAGKLELFNAEVPYNKLAHYLSNYALGDDIINHIEITGTIPADDLKGTFELPPSPGALGQLLKNNAPKKVALKLPSGLSVPNMDRCFFTCENLVYVENLPATVTSMAYCFYGCKNLTTGPDIPATVTDMRYCFKNCTSLTQGPDIPATVTHMRECFKGCTGLQRVKLNCNYNSGGGNFNGTFSGCTALEDGGIKVPLLQLAIYKANAAHMGTTAAKFSAIP